MPGAIRAAHAGGFAAVECHWPYEVEPSAVKQALDETGLPMLGLNTRRGNVSEGENGLAALPGREAEARAAIDEAIDYAVQIGAGNVHVMAGIAEGPDAHRSFTDNLAYACDAAARHERRILIEPLNAHDAPGYFLRTLDQAARIIDQVGARNLKLMFDCYHVGRTESDVIGKLERHLAIVGHIQFASVPDRGAPDHGTVDYGAVFSRIDALGWTTPLGAEYRPDGDTDATLSWMSELR